MEGKRYKEIVSFILWFLLSLIFVLFLIGVLMSALENRSKITKKTSLDPEEKREELTNQEKAAIVTEEEFLSVLEPV